MISRSAFGNAEVSSTAKAAAANTRAISSAAPTASTTRLVVLFVLTFFFLSCSLVHSSLASSIDRRSWRYRWRKSGFALPVHLPPPLWACLHKQMVSPLGTGALLLWVFWACSRSSAAPRVGGSREALYSRNTPRKCKYSSRARPNTSPTPKEEKHSTPCP